MSFLYFCLANHHHHNSKTTHHHNRLIDNNSTGHYRIMTTTNITTTTTFISTVLRLPVPQYHDYHHHDYQHHDYQNHDHQHHQHQHHQHQHHLLISQLSRRVSTVPYPLLCRRGLRQCHTPCRLHSWMLTLLPTAVECSDIDFLADKWREQFFRI